MGHLAVLPVGHMVFGIDPVHKQVLWEKSMLGAHDTARVGPPNYQITVDPHDGSIATGTLHGIADNDVVVLLPHPALRAKLGRRDQLFQCGRNPDRRLDVARMDDRKHG